MTWPPCSASAAPSPFPRNDFTLAVTAAADSDVAGAAAVAARLGLPLLEDRPHARDVTAVHAVLVCSGDRLSMQQTGRGAPGPVGVDPGAAGMRHRRRGGHNELLGRAVGVGRRRELRVIDATGGLARDAVVLADLGCRVAVCERNPVVVELLRAGLRCAGDDPWLLALAPRLRLYPGDVRSQSSQLAAWADVIYLDPMFPPGDKRAAVKKEMALFQRLLTGEEEDAGDLLRWSLAQDVARVVVKRPSRAGALAGQEPSHCIAGRAVRYDVYVRRGLN